MSVHTPTIAIDIGSHTVKLAEFVSPKEGVLALQRFSAVHIGLDPNKEENRHAAVTQAIRQALTNAGVPSNTRGRVIFSVAGHAVFMRGVKLPPVDLMQLDQMIAFEAQQIVPFPLTEVVWDFLVLSGRDNTEKEAIIVAIKSDLLEAEHAAVRAAGVDPVKVDVGPLALYNSYRYNYPPVEHCVLLIDIGARSTNLVFIERDRLYTRILPLAGNTISQTICNEFQEPFSVAEGFKLERGGINLGGNYARPTDRDNARLWKLIRSVVGRIQVEINRSIVFYRNQQGGSAPQQILLTGGSSRLPYIDHFLAEKFEMPVTFFNPLQNVTIQPGVDREALGIAAHSLGEVVGLALRGIGPTPAEINLRPPSIVAEERIRRQQPFVYAALALWFVLFALWGTFYFFQLQAARGVLNSLQQKTETLESLVGRITPLKKTNDQLQATYNQAQRLLTQRDAWGQLLDELNSKVPQGVWITQLTPTYNGQSLDAEVVAAASKGHAKAPASPGGSGAPEINQLQIKGMFEDGLQPEIINRFVGALADSHDGIFDLTPDKIENAILSTDTPQPNSGQLAWNYTLSLKLKQPISLTP